MMKALALVALSLALEAGFLFQVAAPARPAPAAETASAPVARTAAPTLFRG